MSPRAACRLEMLGFDQVYDYVAGKSDWMAAGLAVEGELRSGPFASNAMERNVATCTPDATGGTITGFGADGRCFVVDADGLVLGSVTRAGAREHPDAPAHTWMTEGPTTIRANEILANVLGRMQAADVALVPVTDAGGLLLGVLTLEHGMHALHASHADGLNQVHRHR